MGSLRIRRRSPIALLLGAVLALGAPVLPAQALTSRSITLSASPATAIAGTSITFAGKITNTRKGTPLRIQVKSGSFWQTAVSTVTLTAGGAFSSTVPRPTKAGIYIYRAYAARSGSLAEAISKTVKVTALRKVTVSLKATPVKVAFGASTTLSGKVSPFVAGTVVTVQRSVGGAWSNQTTATVSAKGTYSRAVRPSQTASYRVVVPRKGLNARAISASVKVTVVGGPEVTTASLPGGYQGIAYSATLTKTGAAGTWARTAGALPGGLALDAGTGEIAGTPTAGGTFAFTVRFTETASGYAASKALSITVAPAPVITTSSLPGGTRAAAYSATLTKTGQPGTWSSSTIPAGITLDASTGALSGAPSAAGDFQVTVTFTESAAPNLSASKQLSLHVAEPPAPVITTTSLPDGTRGTAYGPQQLARTGNAGTWAVTTGALPTGVSVSGAGVVSGTPTVAGDFHFTVTFTETANGTNDSQDLWLHVSAPGAPVISTTSLPDAKVGAGYNAQLAASGSGTWSITSGSLPAGITLNGFTGVLSGTPTTAGDSQFIVKYTTLTGNNTKVLTIHVAP